jgi:hypothetical protein
MPRAPRGNAVAARMATHNRAPLLDLDPSAATTCWSPRPRAR